MRPPTLGGVIIALAVIGLAVLFAKRPSSQPHPASPASRQSAALVTTVAASTEPVTRQVAPPRPQWTIPDPDKLPDDSFGRAVRYGRDLIAHTSMTIGPGAVDPSMRYSGNGLECQSCHLDAGTRRFGIPLAGLWAVFPTFVARENDVRTLEDRINGCMERSMNGRALPEGGPEMKAMLAYIRYISDGSTVGQSVHGRGTPALQLPDKPSDLQHGAEIYAAQCALCHQPDGQGKRLTQAEAVARRHLFELPPLWGPDSYNDGAGMARSITAARFIRANMPFGADFEHPVLSGASGK